MSPGQPIGSHLFSPKFYDFDGLSCLVLQVHEVTPGTAAAVCRVSCPTLLSHRLDGPPHRRHDAASRPNGPVGLAPHIAGMRPKRMGYMTAAVQSRQHECCRIEPSSAPHAPFRGGHIPQMAGRPAKPVRYIGAPVCSRQQMCCRKIPEHWDRQEVQRTSMAGRLPRQLPYMSLMVPTVRHRARPLSRRLGCGSRLVPCPIFGPTRVPYMSLGVLQKQRPVPTPPYGGRPGGSRLVPCPYWRPTQVPYMTAVVSPKRESGAARDGGGSLDGIVACVAPGRSCRHGFHRRHTGAWQTPPRPGRSVCP